MSKRPAGETIKVKAKKKAGQDVVQACSENDDGRDESAVDEVTRLREMVEELKNENNILWQTRESLAKRPNSNRKCMAEIREHTVTFTGVVGNDGKIRNAANNFSGKLKGVLVQIQLDLFKCNGSFTPAVSVWLTSDSSTYLTAIIEGRVKIKDSHYNSTSTYYMGNAEMVFLTRGEHSSAITARMHDKAVYVGSELTVVATIKTFCYQKNGKEDEESDQYYRKVDVILEDRIGKKTVDKVFVVDAAYISRWSEFLRAYFDSNMKEGREGKYPIKGCSAKEFQELLDVINPTSKPITKDNIEILLGLADRFIMPALSRKCETFLLDKTKHSIAELKIIGFADKYNLEFTKAIILERLSTTQLIRSKLPHGAEYRALSEEMRSAIQARYYELDCKERGIAEVDGERVTKEDDSDDEDDEDDEDDD